MTNPSESGVEAAQVHELARSIARGQVLCYGELGALCDPPISGFVCGRLMNDVPSGVPWWRVVAKDGSLPVAKRNPDLARKQRDLLEEEGVVFDGKGRIPMDVYRSELALSSKPQTALDFGR